MMHNWTFMLIAGALHLALWVFLIGGVVWVAIRLARGRRTPTAGALEVGPGRRAGSRLAALVGIALIVVGLVGVLITATMPAGSEAMDAMMGRHMAEMMGGESGRDGDRPRAGAPDRLIRADDFSFDPNETRVRRGEAVNVVLDNRGMMFHTFTMPTLGFELRAAPGDEIGGELRPSRVGRYKAICTVPGHADAGMTATVIVED